MSIYSRLGPGTGLNGPTSDAVAKALDEVFDAFEADLQNLITDASRISPDSPETPSRTTLRILGDLIGVTEDLSWDDPTYKYAILARADAAASSGTFADLFHFATYRSPLRIASVDAYPTYVRLYIAGALSLSPSHLATIRREALKAIPDVAGLEILGSTLENAPLTFTFDLGPGLDLGILAEVL